MKQHWMQSMLLCNTSKQGPRCFRNCAVLAQNIILLTLPPFILKQCGSTFFSFIEHTEKNLSSGEPANKTYFEEKAENVS